MTVDSVFEQLAVTASLALCAVCLSSGIADEIDEALQVEELVKEAKKEVATAASEKPRVAEDSTREYEADKPVMTPEEEVAALVSSMQKKELALLRAREEVTSAKDLTRRIVAANRKEKQTMHYNMGCVYKAGRQFQKAEAEFLAALALDHSDAAVHYNLGVLYDDDLKNPSKARSHYAKFLELSPNDKDAAQVVEWLSSLEW